MAWFIFSSVLDSISVKMAGINSFRADVEQVAYVQGKKTIYRGEVFVKKPSFFRWDLKEPERYIVVANADSSWILYKGEVMSQSIPYNLSELLKGDYSGFNVKEIKVKGGWKLLLTSPEAVGFDSMVVFIGKDYLPRSLKIYNFSDWVEIKFSNIRTNLNIPDSLFLKPKP
jgi:outer membrane lipoprotein-sorting protein